MKKLLLLPSLLFLLILHTAAANVCATVKSKKGELLAFVNISFVDSSGKAISNAITDINGHFCAQLANRNYTVVLASIGYKTLKQKVNIVQDIPNLTIVMTEEEQKLNEVEVKQKLSGGNVQTKYYKIENVKANIQDQLSTVSGAATYSTANYDVAAESYAVSGYATNANAGAYSWTTAAKNKTAIPDEAPLDLFKDQLDAALLSCSTGDLISTKTLKESTFSIDVDNASYTYARTALRQGYLPDSQSIHIEEFINFFDYNYSKPKQDVFSMYQEVSPCPWNPNHYLLHLGIQGKAIEPDPSVVNNLVFLIDVSGSMSDDLPLVKQSLFVLLDHLKANDRVALVVYAGNAGVVMNSTPIALKDSIKRSINRLESGGSTAGGAGINLAYKIAKDNFVNGGNNRIMLATDGDFNVGISSTAELEKLIEEKRKENIFLTTLGYGMGNYRDDVMETLADKGNGNYYYVDGMQEANRLFSKEIMSTIFAIAKDVKLQLVFNDQVVKGYKLIGYDNRRLNKEDFTDDKKDAGELGSGHHVTALYEIDADALKPGDNLATLKLRYKAPDKDVSTPLEFPMPANLKMAADQSDAFKTSLYSAMFAMKLRGNKEVKNFTYKSLALMVKNGIVNHSAELKELAELIDLADKNSKSLSEVPKGEDK